MIKNYRPISLLPVFGKVFERIIFNFLFNYFLENKLFTKGQLGFLSGDSCISQLLSITHKGKKKQKKNKIYKYLDCNFSVAVRGVFLNISKAFDKVWHDCLIYKLKSYRVENKLLYLIQNYLTNRQHRALLNGRTSRWTNKLAGVPHGSVLGTLFLTYINDLPNGLKSLCNVFVDGTSLFLKIRDIDTSNVDISND